MQTMTFASTAALQTALSPLSNDQRVQTQALPAADGAWTLSLPESLASLIGSKPPQARLAVQLVAAAAIACSQIRSQIVPDPTHDDAYKNAAAIVGPGATVPSVEPAKTAFADLAAQNGAQPQAFATLVLAIASVSMQLSTSLSALTAATATATTPTQLASALQAFENAINSVISVINAAGLTTISAPPVIIIPGINT